MSTVSNAVRSENDASPEIPAVSDGIFNRALAVLAFKGALVAAAVIYVIITWALHAVARAG